jgi:DNA-directed RNA polymerase subunit RPC12/RpoP
VLKFKLVLAQVAQWKLFHRHPLISISVFAAIAATVGLVMAAFRPDSLAITLLSNVITFIASGLLSYQITYTHEKEQFAKDRANLSKFASRRVSTLSANLLSLTQEISPIRTLEETKRIVEYTLRNLAKDAELSVRDIEDMGRVEGAEIIDAVLNRGDVVDDSGANKQQLFASAGVIDKLVAEGKSNVEDIKYNCPNCGNSNASSLGRIRGTTRHVTCSNCNVRLLIHRINETDYKVVNPSKGRLSDYATGETRSAIKHSGFACPRCQHWIALTRTTDQMVIEKPCFSCLAIVSFDRATGRASLVRDRFPIYVDTIDVNAMECVTCHNVFSARKFKTDDGKEFVCCFHCNTLYLAKSDAKELIERLCPTENCGNIITFKIGKSAVEARQICLDCHTRLVYRRDSDEVKTLERLEIPKVSYESFKSGGNICPHCGKSASGFYTVNHKGEKLSICWNCKNVFEFV